MAFYRCRPNLHMGLTQLQGGLSRASLVSVSLLGSLTGHKSPHGGEFGFSSQDELTTPPKGGGAEYHLSWVVGFALLVHNWPTRLQQGGLLRWCRFPTRLPKSHTGAHRVEFGSHRFFLVRFCPGRVAKSRSNL